MHLFTSVHQFSETKGLVSGACSGCRDAVREAQPGALASLVGLLGPRAEPAVAVRAANLISALAVDSPANQEALIAAGS